MLVTLICTCFVTRTLASEVLVEVAAQGNVETAKVLLSAGAAPDVPQAQLNGKTALHVAAASGHEEIAAALIRALPSRDRAFLLTITDEKTPFDIFRGLDMAGPARRLEALVDERWGTAPEQRLN